MELLLQGDSQINFQIPKAGVSNSDNKWAGLEKGEPTGEQTNRPKVNLCGPQGPNRQLTKRTWKRFACNTNGPLSMAPQSCPPKQKRSQHVLLEEKVERSLKKNKAYEDSSSINEVEISAEVAMQPRRKP